MKQIKNISNNVVVFCGKELQINETYLIPILEESAWANDEAVISAIVNSTLLVISNGTELSNTSDAVGFLKDLTLKEVITQFEKQDKTLKIASTSADVDENGYATALLKIPGVPGSGDGRYLTSGIAFFSTHQSGDKVISITIVDQDNLLGYGAGVTIGSYTDSDVDSANSGWFMMPKGYLRAETIGGYGFAPAGFYFKVVGKKVSLGPTSEKMFVNFEWGKKE